MFDQHLIEPTPDGKLCYLINGRTIIAKKRESFWDYIERKGLDRKTFMRLSSKDRESTYLTWRYGTHCYEGNKDTEATDIFLCSGITDEDLANMKESSRVFWTLERESHKQCMAIKAEIGLIVSRSKVKEMVKEVADKTVLNYQDVQDQIVWAQ